MISLVTRSTLGSLSTISVLHVVSQGFTSLGRIFSETSFLITNRSNPDGVDVNARCLDRSTIKKLDIKPFDGQNWEQNAESLKHLSEEDKINKL